MWWNTHMHTRTPTFMNTDFYVRSTRILSAAGTTSWWCVRLTNTTSSPPRQTRGRPATRSWSAPSHLSPGSELSRSEKLLELSRRCFGQTLCSGVHSAGSGWSPLRLAQEWFPRAPGSLLLRCRRWQGGLLDNELKCILEMILNFAMLTLFWAPRGASLSLLRSPL